MDPDEKKHILLVDDHPIIVLAVRSLIEARRPGFVVHSAHTAADGLALAAQHRPALAVVDLSLPDGDGLDLIRQIKEVSVDCAVLIFSMQNELHFGPRALKAGASGYLMKGDKVSAVLEAIEKIEAGGIYCSPALTEALMRNIGRETAGGVDALTDREFRVFRLMADGLSTKEIAQTMGISTKTVDSHREKMKWKLGCNNGTELLLMARDWLRDNPGGS